MINLFEDYKNLNMLDRSFFIDNYNNSVNFRGSEMSPESKIVVSNVSPHRFSSIMDIINNNEDIAAIVVRAHNRQLLLISKNNSVKSIYGYRYNNYVAVFSANAYDNYNDHGYSKLLRIDSEAQVKTLISRTVKAFYEKAPEGVKKKWDILIVYKDENVNKKMIDRKNAKQDRVITPHEKGYSEYIERLQNLFQQRAEIYIDSRRINTTNSEEIKKYLMSKIKIEKLKFKGNTYRAYEQSFNYPYGKFRYVSEDDTVEPRIISISVEFEGLKLKIKEIRTSNNRWDSFRDMNVLD